MLPSCTERTRWWVALSVLKCRGSSRAGHQVADHPNVASANKNHSGQDSDLEVLEKSNQQKHSHHNCKVLNELPIVFTVRNMPECFITSLLRWRDISCFPEWSNLSSCHSVGMTMMMMLMHVPIWHPWRIWEESQSGKTSDRSRSYEGAKKIRIKPNDTYPVQHTTNRPHDSTTLMPTCMNNCG